jgi:hypothetical protein
MKYGTQRHPVVFLALAMVVCIPAVLVAQSDTSSSSNQASSKQASSSQASSNQASSNPASSTDPHQIPVMDGGIGDCTVDFTVTDNAQAPVYDARIHVHINYRFGGFHKLDLDQATNIDGKARFTGLPARTKHGLFFTATQGDRTGTAFVDPDKTCNANLTIVL